MAGCSAVLPTADTAVPQQSQEHLPAASQLAAPVALSRVSVDWQHNDILRQPQLEARRLSELIYQQLEREALISADSSDELRVTVLEVFLRSGGRGKIGSDYLTGSIDLLDGNGMNKRQFRVKANYTQRGGDPVDVEDRLDELYAKFSDLTVRELNNIQPIDSSVANNTAQ